MRIQLKFFRVQKLLFFLLLMSLSGLYLSPFIRAMEHGFGADNDAYVSSLEPDITHPDTTLLQVNNEGSTKDTYIRFETADLNAQITTAYLKLSISEVSANLELRVISTATGWSEETLTWNNKPASYGEITTYSISEGYEGSIKIKFPDADDPQGAIISLCISLSSQALGHLRITSKEGGNTEGPRLYFVEESIPGIQLSMLIVIIGICSIVLFFKMRKVMNIIRRKKRS
jgi:hypothetical protein